MKKIINTLLAALVMILMLAMLVIMIYYGLFRNELSVMSKVYVQLILGVMFFVILKIVMYF